MSPFSGRGPSPCGNAVYPTLAAYGEGDPDRGPRRVRRASPGTSFAAPQVTGAVALLAGMFPGATPTPSSMPSCAVRVTSGTPGADADTGAGILNVAQAAALLAGGDHAGPRVTVNARWSQDSAHPGLVLSGRAHERGGGTSAGVSAQAFIGRQGCRPLPSHSPPRRLPAASASWPDRSCPRQVRRLEDGRHSLFVRARDAAGNWGPVRMVVLPDRPAAAGRARLAASAAATSCDDAAVREPDSASRRCATASRSTARPGAGARSSRPPTCGSRCT